MKSLRRRTKGSKLRKNRKPSMKLNSEHLEPRRLLTGLVFVESEFFGGAGDQSGRDIDIRDDRVYVAGADDGQGLIINYPTSLGSPLWSNRGGANSYSGVQAVAGNVYAIGDSLPPLCGASDGVGSIESKTGLGVYTTTGTQSSCESENFFTYTGTERYFAAAESEEAGSNFIYVTGVGEVDGFGPHAYIIAKHDDAGNLINAATDSTVGIAFGSTANPGGESYAYGVTVLDSHAYIAGQSNWNSEGSVGRPAIWKYDTDLNLVARFKNSSLSGQYFGISNDGVSTYVVGATGTPGVANGRDYLIEKYEQDGSRVWSTNFGGAGNQELWDVLSVGGLLYAAGTMTATGAGSSDIVILEIDPDDGDVLSTTTFGGSKNDEAFGIATDGAYIYVTGSSRSFASEEGNAIGQSDSVVLRYALTSSIQGAKFSDLDNDGVRDPGEPGLSGWTISLDQNFNNRLDEGEPVTTTDDSGNYSFNGLLPGTYYVREQMTVDWEQSYPYSGIFTPSVEYDADLDPHFLATGDLDNDGNNDVVVTSRSADNVTVLLNDGSGTFRSNGVFPAGDGAESIEIVDLDRDGNLDLVIANVGSNDVSILLGEGTGSFDLLNSWQVGTTPKDVVVQDFNNDGILDIITANFDSNNVSVLLGKGDASFLSASSYPTMSNGAESLVSFDFEGDGDADLAVANALTDDVVVLINDREGMFAFGTRINVGQHPNAMAACDLDRDGDVDFAIANSHSYDISILTNNNNGTFSSGPRVVVGHAPYGVSCSDVDGDGDPDLVTADFNSDRAVVFTNEGLAGFSDALRLPVGVNPHDVALADLNGDGRVDLATPNVGSDNVSLVLQVPGIHLVTLDCGQSSTGVDFGNHNVSGLKRDIKLNSLSVVSDPLEDRLRLEYTLVNDLTNLALGASASGSDTGWGGGTNKPDLVDGLASYPEWKHGLAAPLGQSEFQITIDFGHVETFDTVVPWWHPAPERAPDNLSIQAWNGVSWETIYSTTDALSHLGDEDASNSYKSQSMWMSFDPVSSDKVRLLYDNAEISSRSSQHGWAYEVEVFNTSGWGFPRIDVGSYLSSDSLMDGEDQFVGFTTITNAADLTNGDHVVEFPIGGGRGQLALPGAGYTDSEAGQYLLIALDDTNTIREMDVDPHNEDNTRIFSGIYRSNTGSVNVYTVDDGKVDAEFRRMPNGSVIWMTSSGDLWTMGAASTANKLDSFVTKLHVVGEEIVSHDSSGELVVFHEHDGEYLPSEHSILSRDAVEFHLMPNDALVWRTNGGGLWSESQLNGQYSGSGNANYLNSMVTELLISGSEVISYEDSGNLFAFHADNGEYLPGNWSVLSRDAAEFHLMPNDALVWRTDGGGLWSESQSNGQYSGSGNANYLNSMVTKILIIGSEIISYEDSGNLFAFHADSGKYLPGNWSVLSREATVFHLQSNGTLEWRTADGRTCYAKPENGRYTGRTS